ncbi:MAG TPA: hypothetical protein VNU68_35040 [Verrucomicrobiae bacterium]|nr:hypothetical protein [Verrucomicrobiae bacterium]
MSGTNNGTGEPSTTGNVTTTSNVRQLSDGNGLRGGPGTQMGFSASDKLGFYGATPIVQPAGSLEAAVNTGQAGGLVMTFASLQSPSSVVTLTSAEQSITVQNGTGSTLTPITGDFMIVNKPTSQAGIGVGNVRQSSANVIGLTFNNFSAGTLTPTASQVYGIVGVRGIGVLTAVLTPAAVVSSTTVEQLFTVPGLAVGSAIAVNKPTTNAGLDIVGVRIAGDDSVGITFANLTTGTLTPTAGQTYSFFQTAGIGADNNTVLIAANSTLTPATVATITTADITLTSANVLVDDVQIGVQKPTLQAGLGLVAGRVSAANTLKETFVNPTAGTLTPTASEIYLITLNRMAPAAPAVVYSPTLTPTVVAANTTAEQTFTVTGLVSGSVVIVNKPTAQRGLGIVGVRVSALNTLAINFCNATATAITPTPAEVYTVANFQALIDTTSGNAMAQPVFAADTGTTNVANAARNALVSLGLMSGS